MGLPRVKKPTTRKGKSFVESRAPKVVENDKVTILFKGGKTNNELVQFLMDVYQLKKPLVQKLTRKNDVHLFEDCSFIEKMGSKMDASLFVEVANSKKRPNTVVIGRLFDSQLLDMVELQMYNYKSIDQFGEPKMPIGTKPCIVMQGLNFEVDETFKKVGNLFVDLFRGPVIPQVRLQGLELVVTLTATEERILLRTYRAVLKKSGEATPRVELVEVGPSADFEPKRTKFASENLLKRAMKQPKELKQKMRKNTSEDVFGTKLGRIHVGRQNVENLRVRKVKALRQPKKTKQN